MSAGRGTDPVGELEHAVSRVLRAGVALAVALLVVGLAAAFAGGPLGRARDVGALTGPDTPTPHAPLAVLEAMAHRQAAGFLVAGLLVLVLTPLVRVVTSVVAYRRAHDRAYLALTLVVLGLLGLSTVLGAA